MVDAEERGRSCDGSTLPRWRRVLAVVAHPDDESFGLGGVLDTFTASGSQVEVLCLTRGEASTLGVAAQVDLPAVRAAEIEAAGRLLGVSGTTLLDLPDGGLDAVADADLVNAVLAGLDAADAVDTDGILVFDPEHGLTGHPDHAAASRAGVAAGRARGIPVLGWTLPVAVADTLNEEFGAGFVGHPDSALDVTIEVDRARQRTAIAAHASQAVDGSVLWRRIALLGAREHLRWLYRPTD